MPDATGNLSLHTDHNSGDSGNGGEGGADLINVGDIGTPYFAISKIIDVVIEKKHAGTTRKYYCNYNDEDRSIIGGYIGRVDSV